MLILHCQLGPPAALTSHLAPADFACVNAGACTVQGGSLKPGTAALSQAEHPARLLLMLLQVQRSDPARLLTHIE